jgi:hypothetical protein
MAINSDFVTAFGPRMMQETLDNLRHKTQWHPTPHFYGRKVRVMYVSISAYFIILLMYACLFGIQLMILIQDNRFQTQGQPRKVLPWILVVAKENGE